MVFHQPNAYIWDVIITLPFLFVYLNQVRYVCYSFSASCCRFFLWQLIIRGKEAPDKRAKRDGLAPMNEGYAKDHEGLITLFSAPDHPQFQVCSTGCSYWLTSTCS